MHRVTILYRFLIIVCAIAISVEAYPYCNPGIKIGYEFGGDRPGFLLGVEISFVDINDDFNYAGVVIGAEWNFSQSKPSSYLEIEGGLGVLGAALGVEWKDRLLFRSRIFLGVFVPFLSLAYTSDFAFELAGIVQFPIALTGNGVNPYSHYSLIGDFKAPSLVLNIEDK